MTAVADAERAARHARSRLAAAAAFDGGARGALTGGAAALAVAAAVRGFGDVVPSPWLLALPAGCAVAGALRAALRPIAIDRAALALDAAAGTDEAFVSALTAGDADPAMRDLAARFALARCPVGEVPRRMPFRAPAALAAAVLATGAAAALVLVAPAPPPPAVPRAPGVEIHAPPAAAADVSPLERTDRLTAALRAGGAAPAALAESVQRDLPAVPDEALRRLAEALARGGSAEAAAALDALAGGDRAAAVQALLAALGAVAAAGDAPGGGAASSATVRGPDGAAGPAPAGETWPLRYDRSIRRWRDLRTEENR